jgi:hypothetical protein
MANIKFSGFSAVAPVSTTLMVGVAGGVNTKFVLGDIQLSDLGGAIDLGTQVSGVLPLTDGGTGASAQPAILDNVTNAASQPVNDIIVADVAGAVFLNPSQHPNVPVDVVTSLIWTGITNPYFNFTNGASVLIPFDTIYVNRSTSSTQAPNVINLTSPTDTTIVPQADGYYKVSINLHFFDLFGDIDIFCGVFDYTGAPVAIANGGLIDKKDVTGNTDQNFFGSSVIFLSGGTPYGIVANFSGGGGQNPFPSNSGQLFTNVTIEKVG